MPNVELLRKTLAHIETNPEQWDQTFWVNDCGTAYCFAGHAVRLHGGRIVATAVDDVYVIPPTGEDVTNLDVGTVIDGVQAAFIQEYAAQLLGLTSSQGMRLFCAINDLTDIRRIVGELCADEVTDHG